MSPIRPKRRAEPFDDPDWLFEIKHDGFRALAYVAPHGSRLVSRNAHRFTEFGPLIAGLEKALGGRAAILDGEIVCLDDTGRSQFYELLARRGAPYFYAFDLIWLEGEDLRDEPLLERKKRLLSLVPQAPSRLLYVEHLEAQGVALYQKTCEMDLEGIVAKRKRGLYREGTRWWKIKNAAYSQAEGRGELFDARRRGSSRVVDEGEEPPGEG